MNNKSTLSSIIFLLLISFGQAACAGDESDDGDEDPNIPELEAITVYGHSDPGFAWGGPSGGGGEVYSGGSSPPEPEEIPESPDDGCSTSKNPVVFKTGNKFKEQLDFHAEHRAGLYLKRSYNANASDRAGIFGKGWFSNFDLTLIFTYASGTQCYASPGISGVCVSPTVPNSALHSVTRVTPDGALYSYIFDAPTGTWRSRSPKRTEAVVRHPDGSWFIQYKNRAVEKYNVAGFITSSRDSHGDGYDFTYLPSNHLQAVTHTNGSKIQFEFAGRTVSRVIDPVGNQYSYSYANGVLTGLQWPGPGASTRTYHYSTGNPLRFAGISDDDIRYSENDYHANGQVFHSGLAGGVDQETFTYGPTSTTTKYTQVTNAAGGSVQYHYQFIAGEHRLVKADRAASVGCPAVASAYGYDAAGALIYTDDFVKHRVCYRFDLARQAELVRVEGLHSSTDCATVMGDNIALPATGTRKISTELHPEWHLEVRRAAPLKRTTWIYNGQPDPMNGNAVASCVIPDSALPANAGLPSPDKPIAVMCSRIEQATTDINGSQGFNAPFDSTVPARVWRYTYNQWGKALSVTDPGGRRTSYAYYTNTSFTADPNAAGHHVGDLMRTTNAKGHVTNYLEYDKAGRVLKIEDANHVIAKMSYWPGGSIKSVTQGVTAAAPAGLTTWYDFSAIGLLKRVTQPDGSRLDYGYDAAQRLRTITDSMGNVVIYATSVDTANQQSLTTQSVKDASGTLLTNIDRVYDALGRLRKVKGAMR